MAAFKILTKKEDSSHMLKKLTIVLTLIAAAFMSVSAFQAFQGAVSGHGTLLVQDTDGNTKRRQFTVNARSSSDGTVSAIAVLHNPAYNGANGQNYQLQVDISCMNRYGNLVFFGGTTRRTNDPNLVDAVYFSVEDNGEPGRNIDRISTVFFFDDDPDTTGDPQLCMNNQPGDFPMLPIESGNISVR